MLSKFSINPSVSDSYPRRRP